MHATLEYADPKLSRSPISPVLGRVSLLLALAPFIAVPFVPAERALTLAVGVVIFGSLLSPVNFICAVLLTRSYARRKTSKGAAVAAAVFSGINGAFVTLAIVSIYMNGMPC